MNWVLHFLEAEGSLAAWRQQLEDEAAMLHGQLAQLLAPDLAAPLNRNPAAHTSRLTGIRAGEVLAEAWPTLLRR